MAQKYLVAGLSLALFVSLLVVGAVDSKRRAESKKDVGAATAALLNPQVERGHQVYLKYSCNACHGLNATGGIKNLNSETGGEINGLTRLGETFTQQELEEKIRNGVAEVGRSDPTGPDPPLRMPSYRELIAGQEMKDLTAYLYGLGPKQKKESQW